ncbi:MAG TPA: imidazole glycerol phosphate synthase subunit HisF [Gemmatimonadaceae bacterium]
MTLAKRVIVCLDVTGGRVVKGVRFADLRDVGDPASLAARYEAAGADELVFLDVSATVDDRATLLDSVRLTAERLFVPLTVGGGIRSVDDAAGALRAGADKVAVNSAAVANPALLTELSRRFGAQCVVASIDARRTGHRWDVFTRAGTTPAGRDAVAWARECADRGAGEIVLTSIDRDGTRTGYDLELTRAVADAITVPVIASGGAGSPDHICDVFTHTAADAALIAGVVHDGEITIATIKRALAARNILIRDAA